QLAWPPQDFSFRAAGWCTSRSLRCELTGSDSQHRPIREVNQQHAPGSPVSYRIAALQPLFPVRTLDGLDAIVEKWIRLDELGSLYDDFVPEADQLVSDVAATLDHALASGRFPKFDADGVVVGSNRLDLCIRPEDI